MWIWQNENWPNYQWDSAKLAPLLSNARQSRSHLFGLLQVIDDKLKQGISSEALAQEMVSSSRIEGEILDRDSVRSSIAHRLGLGQSGLNKAPDGYVEGVLEMMLDAIQNYQQPLTLDRLYGWHAALFPTGYSQLKKIDVGMLRQEGDMTIVSGPISKETIHYLAPPSHRLPALMTGFINWINQTDELDPIIKAGVAHLWFEQLHPFDDGNGRIGRAIVEWLLSKEEQLGARYYSLSSYVLTHRKAYYAELGQLSKGDSLDITEWLQWFLSAFVGAIDGSLATIDAVVRSLKFWQRHSDQEINARQRKVLKKMLDADVAGYAGGMTTKKYTAITKVSRATAYRELADLVQKQCLQPLAGKGRGSAYEVVW